MPLPVTDIATELLEEGGLQELRIHEFSDDDRAIEKLYSEFSVEFELAEKELNRKYGAPARAGREDDSAIPLNGVFCFAVWDVDGTELYLAAAHEDQGVPILLMIGCDSGNRA